MKGRPMTDGTPWKHILRFALPVLAGSFLQQLYNTVDTVVVGNYASESALSAVGTTGSFAFLFLAIAVGFSAGNGVVVAQYFGAKNEKMVRQNASTGIILLMGIGVLVTIISLIIAKPVYENLIIVPTEVLDMTLSYFRVFAIGFVFMFGFNIISSILRAIGDSASTFYFLIVSSVANVGLDLLFVAVFSWGVAGAAAATVISQIGAFIAAYIYMIKKYPVFRFRLREYTWHTDQAIQTMKMGYPIALQLIIVSIGLTFLQRAVNSFGKTMMAAFTVGQRMEMYINLPCNAFQTTLATYTGQNIGAGRMDRVKLGARQTILMSILMTIVISVCIWLLAGNISTMFGLSSDAMGYSNEYLHAVAIINIVLSMYIPLFGVFQGSNHPGIPAIVAISAFTIRIIITYSLMGSAYLGHSILWWNGLFGFGTGFTIVWSYYLSGKWQKNSKLTYFRNGV